MTNSAATRRNARTPGAVYRVRDGGRVSVSRAGGSHAAYAAICPEAGGGAVGVGARLTEGAGDGGKEGEDVCDLHCWGWRVVVEEMMEMLFVI